MRPSGGAPSARSRPVPTADSARARPAPQAPMLLTNLLRSMDASVVVGLRLRPVAVLARRVRDPAAEGVVEPFADLGRRDRREAEDPAKLRVAVGGLAGEIDAAAGHDGVR